MTAPPTAITKMRSGCRGRTPPTYRHPPPPKLRLPGIALMRSDGLWCYGTNTAVEDISLPPLGDEGNVEVILEHLDFVAGTYYLDVAVHAMDGYPHDYHHGLYAFSMKSDLQEVGVCRIPHRWVIKPFVTVP